MSETLQPPQNTKPVFQLITYRFSYEGFFDESKAEYRQGVTGYDLVNAVEEIRYGKTPVDFPWMEAIIAHEVDEGVVNDRGYRFMAVINELVRAQNEQTRDTYYEQRVAALGRLLFDSPDPDGNYLGYYLRLKTKSGLVHDIYHGNLTHNADDNKWWAGLRNNIPAEDVVEVVPWS